MRPYLSSLVLALSLVTVSALHADPAQTTSPLAAFDQNAIGLNKLKEEQKVALHAFVDRDVQAARQGDVVAFAKSFTERRTTEERQRAGIDLLSDAERIRLDAAVATLIASRPASSYVYQRTASSTGEIIRERSRPIVHGQVSLFVGGGSDGSSWYGGAFDVAVTDPSRKFTVMLGASEVRGRGPARCGYGW